MNRKLLFSVLLLATALTSQGKNLKALFAHKTFYSPQSGPYVETYLSVVGSSVEFVKLENGKYQGSIEVTAKYTLGDDIKSIDKYNLLSPEVENTGDIQFNFLDQQRTSLSAGKYNLELSVKDKNTSAAPFVLKQEIILSYDSEKPAVSDIELIDSYTKEENASALNKSGFNIIPLVDNFYSKEKNTLNFYTEVYNTSKLLPSEVFLIHYYIQNFENKTILMDYSSFSKKQSAPVIPIMASFNIAALASGNYNVVVDVKNKNNELIATNSVFFFRHNNIERPESAVNINDINTSNTFADKFTDKAQLAEHIASLQPIANASESTYIENQLKLSDIAYMKKFFYHFWQQRDAINPEQAWVNYNKEVEVVQASYGTRAIKGYNTDRGRVYLQYGKPNTISQSHNEPSAYPYEIWHYYKIKSQSNKKFVFYNPDMIGKNFSLLHSDMPGEPYNQQWEAKLHSRNYTPGNFDDKSTPDYYGKKTEENFTTPR